METADQFLHQTGTVSVTAGDSKKPGSRLPKGVKLNDIVHVNDIAMPKGVEPISKLKADNPPVATVHVPALIAQIEPLVPPPPAEPSQTPK